MNGSKQGIAPESLSSATRLIPSMREQKSKGQKTVQMIEKAIQTAKEQIRVLEEMQEAKSPQ